MDFGEFQEAATAVTDAPSGNTEQVYPMMPPQQFYPMQPPQLPPSQSQRRRRPSTGVIALLLIFILIVVGGSVLLYYASVIHPAQLHAQATATAQSGATALVQSRVNATATANALTPQDLYTLVTSKAPTLNDSLNGQGSTNWQNFGNTGQCTFNSGALHATSTQQAGALCLYQGSTYTNFAFQVQMTFIHGDLGGINFRFDQTNRKLYFFAISPTGVFVLFSIQSSISGQASEKILAAQASTAINTAQDQANILTVIARGIAIDLYINKQFVFSVNDSTSGSGMVGVTGGDSKGSVADVTFTNAQIWDMV